MLLSLSSRHLAEGAACVANPCWCVILATCLEAPDICKCPMGLRLQVTSFLRTNQDSLDKAQLGELLGHHEDFAIAVMHAWIDSEPSMAGQAIDQSLRKLLAGFRLPGEAQKIDRIMEKFAEVSLKLQHVVYIFIPQA